MANKQESICISIVGHNDCGKTTLIDKMRHHSLLNINDVFPDIQSITKKIQFEFKEVPLRINILGQPNVVIFVYSMHDKNTFNYDMWNKYIQCYNNMIKNNDNHAQIIFIHNKIDLLDSYQDNNVTCYDMRGKQFCDKYGFTFYEMSMNSDDDMVFIKDILKSIAKEYFETKYPITCRHDGNSNKCGSIFYDGLTIFISFADLGTDLWMLYQYYNKGRKPFFIIGLIIIIIAQLAYCFVFINEFTRDYNTWKKLRLLLKIFPFSWILGVVMYLSEENQWFHDIIMAKTFGLTVNKSYTRDVTKSDAYNWVQEKLNKHIGFILESICEAFPASILQMIAIVIYKEANIIAIISILLSMTSVSTKALIFSRSIDNGIFLWNWLCACAVKIYIYPSVYCVLTVSVYECKYRTSLECFS